MATRNPRQAPVCGEVKRLGREFIIGTSSSSSRRSYDVKRGGPLSSSAYILSVIAVWLKPPVSEIRQGRSSIPVAKLV